MNQPNLVDAVALKGIRTRRKDRYSNCDQPGARRDADAALLFAYAEHVIETLGLDVSKPGAVFDLQESESGSADVEAAMDHLSIGDEATIVFGYYTPGAAYRMVPTVNLEPCEKCNGKGCFDWAGDDCPADGVRPFPVAELDAQFKD